MLTIKSIDIIDIIESLNRDIYIYCIIVSLS